MENVSRKRDDILSREREIEREENKSRRKGRGGKFKGIEEVRGRDERRMDDKSRGMGR